MPAEGEFSLTFLFLPVPPRYNPPIGQGFSIAFTIYVSSSKVPFSSFFDPRMSNFSSWDHCLIVSWLIQSCMNCVNKEISLLPGPGSIEAREIGDGFLKKTNGCEVSSETDLKQIKRRM